MSIGGQIKPQKESEIDRQVVRRFLSYFRAYRPRIFLIFLTMIFVGLADTAVALASKFLMELFSGISQSGEPATALSVHFHRMWGDRVLYDFTVEDADSARRLLWIISIATLGLVVVKGTIHFTKEYMMWGVTHRILMTLKRQLFSRVVHLPLSFFDREKSGDSLSRITYDMSQLENSIRSSFILAKSFVYGSIFITAMFIMDWSLTLLVLGIFPISGVIIKLFGDKIRKVSRNVSINVADYTSFLGEAITGAKVIKAFCREQDKEESFESKIKDNFRYNMKIARLGTLHSPAQDIFASLGMVGIILFCGYRMLNGVMTIGDLTGFVVLLFNAYKPIKTLGESNVVLQRALASGRRIFSLIDEPAEDSIIGSGTKIPEQVQGDIRFDKVKFSYHDEIPILREISFSIKAGETVALVGPSGGGKSTIVNLIPRFYPLREGRIELDGVDTREYNLECLRGVMAVVPQETILFSGTVIENIRLSRPDASDTLVHEAAKAANAHSFILELNEGYDAEVGERGVQLSGGQRQRIALARAILRDPTILLLDEATSSLDSESEKLIQEALEEFRQDRTTIIIAHRLSTILSADRIIVVKEGRIFESGTHDELYAEEGLYHKLYTQQFDTDSV